MITRSISNGNGMIDLVDFVCVSGVYTSIWRPRLQSYWERQEKIDIPSRGEKNIYKHIYKKQINHLDTLIESRHHNLLKVMITELYKKN